LDNVTHTLIGALLGESAARSTPAPASDRENDVRRTMFLSVMVVGSNLPDLDVLYSFGSGDKLAYLLEHRGHTHTVVGALFAAAAMLVVCALALRMKRISLSRRDRTVLVALALLAPLLHIAMDSLNTYGVHPWWPIDNRWYYGDAVFIVEPLFWASAASLAFLLRSYVGRGFVVLTLVAALYLALTTGLVAPGSIALFCIVAIAMMALGRYAEPKLALGVAIGLCVSITAMFAIAGRQAASRIDAYAATHLHAWTTLDRVLTPLPMNPLCWEAILVQSAGDRYALRRALVSLVSTPWLRCPDTGLDRGTTAPLVPVAVPAMPGLRWYGEIVGSRDALRMLDVTSCRAAAFLRFARAPWSSERAGEGLIGDLRYDREPELGFAELELHRTSRCPRYVPPWIPPRSDLLQR
jgi:inner membrane protein